jgi:hypothetical protein
MYGQAPSEAEIDTILHVPANAESARYQDMLGQ